METTSKDKDLYSCVLVSGVLVHRDIDTQLLTLQLDNDTFVQVCGKSDEITAKMLEIPLYTVVRALGGIGLRKTEKNIFVNYVIADCFKGENTPC